MCVAASGNVGIGTTTPTHPLHVNANTGIRQNSLYISGGEGWSSLSYNAHHDEANGQWIFADPSHKAVTIELDDAEGSPRFQVSSTTTQAPTKWVQRLAVEGNSGNVLMAHNGGNVGIGTPDPKAKLTIAGSNATVNVETAEVLRVLRPGVGGVKNNSAGFSIGAFEPGISGRSRLDIKLADAPSESNAWGAIPNVTVMTLLGNGNVGIGIENPSYAQLHVSGQIATGRNTASAGAITFFPPDGAAWFHIDNGPAGGRPRGRLRISYGGKPGEHEIMSLDQDGNVGIVSIIPHGRLHISSAGKHPHPQLCIEQTDQNEWARIRLNRADKEGNQVGQFWDISVGGSVGSEAMNFYVQHKSNVMTLTHDGKVTILGHIVLTQADCAEEFDIEEFAKIEPGTVMVLDQNGTLRQSESAYDKRVAGVISGAGDYKPGIILDKQQVLPNRKPLALVGKVYCKVDARYAPIEVGGLLTTSPTSGHAMKADDPLRAPGSVIGKALCGLQSGQGLVPILVALQ